jgi:hypothetical protein
MSNEERATALVHMVNGARVKGYLAGVASRIFEEAGDAPRDLVAGDVVRPADAHLDEGDLIGVVSLVMPKSVQNPYSVDWSNGQGGCGFDRERLLFVLRPTVRASASACPHCGKGGSL